MTYEQSDYKVTFNGVEIGKGIDFQYLESLTVTGEVLDELVKIPVRDDTPRYCEHNDCGWCYSASALANDDNGRCNNPQGSGGNLNDGQ